MAMTTQEMIAMLMPAVAGMAQGALGARQQGQQNQLTQQQYMNQLLANKANIGQALQQNRQNQYQAGLNASPLGNEQQYVQKMRMMQALLPAIASARTAAPTDPGILSAYKPGSNYAQQVAGNPGLQQSVGDPATEAALAERRKMIAQVNPNVQFGSLSQYGLSGSQDESVENTRLTALADLKTFEQQQRDLAYQQIQPQTSTDQTDKKKGGFWSKVGSIAKVAVPIVLAATGVGIPAAMAITAGTNIAASKMQGKDWGDAIQSGAIGAATGAVGAGALGSASRAGMSAATQKALAQGALSAADTKMQGGTTGQALTSGLTAGVGSKLASNYQAGRADTGLNNQMTSASLPLGSQGVPQQAGAGQLQLQSKPSMMSMLNGIQQARGVQSAMPQQPNLPVTNKAKPAQPYAPQPPVPFMPSHGGPSGGASGSWGPPQQTGPVDRLYDLPKIGAGNPGDADGWGWLGDQANTFMQQPLIQQMGNPMVQIMGGAMIGPAMAARSAMRPGVAAAMGNPAAEQTVQGAMAAMGKNPTSVGWNQQLLRSVQPQVQQIPGRITQQMDPAKLKAMMDQYARTRAMLTGGR